MASYISSFIFFIVLIGWAIYIICSHFLITQIDCLFLYHCFLVWQSFLFIWTFYPNVSMFLTCLVKQACALVSLLGSPSLCVSIVFVFSICVYHIFWPCLCATLTWIFVGVITWKSFFYLYSSIFNISCHLCWISFNFVLLPMSHIYSIFLARQKVWFLIWSSCIWRCVSPPLWNAISSVPLTNVLVFFCLLALCISSSKSPTHDNRGYASLQQEEWNGKDEALLQSLLKLRADGRIILWFAKLKTYKG